MKVSLASRLCSDPKLFFANRRNRRKEFYNVARGSFQFHFVFALFRCFETRKKENNEIFLLTQLCSLLCECIITYSALSAFAAALLFNVFWLSMQIRPRVVALYQLEAKLYKLVIVYRQGRWKPKKEIFSERSVSFVSNLLKHSTWNIYFKIMGKPWMQNYKVIILQNFSTLLLVLQGRKFAQSLTSDKTIKLTLKSTESLDRSKDLHALHISVCFFNVSIVLRPLSWGHMQSENKNRLNLLKAKQTTLKES